MLRVFEGWMIINQYGNHRAVAIFGLPSHRKSSLERPWGVFGDSWGILGRLSASWRCLELNLKASESAIRRLGDVSEALWDILRGSWGVLGRPRRLPGIILEAFLKDFLPS